MTRERRLPDDDLSRWIRALPDTWQFAEDDLTPSQRDQLVDEIISGARDRRRRAKARWRRTAITSVVAVGIGGGAVAVAAWLRTEQPTRPNEIVVCRAEADLEASAVAIKATRDPIGDCARVWTTAFDDFLIDGQVPELSACVAPSGVPAVFPGPVEVCGQLGLPVLEQPLSPENEAILQLNERIRLDINAQPCARADEVRLAAERLVAESNLEGWTVVISPGWEAAECAKAGADAPTRTITVFGI